MGDRERKIFIQLAQIRKKYRELDYLKWKRHYRFHLWNLYLILQRSVDLSQFKGQATGYSEFCEWVYFQTLPSSRVHFV